MIVDGIVSGFNKVYKSRYPIPFTTEDYLTLVDKEYDDFNNLYPVRAMKSLDGKRYRIEINNDLCSTDIDFPFSLEQLVGELPDQNTIIYEIDTKSYEGKVITKDYPDMILKGSFNG